MVGHVGRPWVWVWYFIINSRVARLGCDIIGQAMEAYPDPRHAASFITKFSEVLDEKPTFSC